MELKEFFEEYGIEYWTSGKNVSKGWNNVQCPFCEDYSNHLGIRLKDLRVNCWKCGYHPITSTVQELLQCSYRDAKKLSLALAGSAGEPPLTVDKKSLIRKYSLKVSLPQESSTNFTKLHVKYLKRRGFNAKKIIEKFKLRSVHTIGKYKFRIIIPFYQGGRLVSFSSRDITGKQEPPYLHGSPEESPISPKQLLYNYDSITPGLDAFALEGPVDVWKMGDGSFGLTGVEYTEEQIRLIMKKRIRVLYIMFDSFKHGKPDKAGRRAAKKFARVIAPVVKRVEVLTLTSKDDPGELNLSQVNSIKRDLRFCL